MRGQPRSSNCMTAPATGVKLRWHHQRTRTGLQGRPWSEDLDSGFAPKRCAAKDAGARYRGIFLANRVCLWRRPIVECNTVWTEASDHGLGSLLWNWHRMGSAGSRPAASEPSYKIVPLPLARTPKPVNEPDEGFRAWPSPRVSTSGRMGSQAPGSGVVKRQSTWFVG
jgi:hypothetical protein